MVVKRGQGASVGAWLARTTAIQKQDLHFDTTWLFQYISGNGDSQTDRGRYGGDVGDAGEDRDDLASATEGRRC